MESPGLAFCWVMIYQPADEAAYGFETTAERFVTTALSQK